MIIQIDDTYRIITDEHQYVVQRSKIGKEAKAGSSKNIKAIKPENVGKVKWINIAYISNIGTAIRFICKNITLLNDDTKTILDKLDVVYERIQELDITLQNKLID